MTLDTEALSPVENAEPAAVAAADDYDAASIDMLKNADHIRQNPGVYVSDGGVAGLHHLFYEVIHNSIDEAMAGHCRNIEVTINVDGSITIEDDGRGIPVEPHPIHKRSALELVMCEVGAGGKFRKDSYKVSGGLHGMGVKAVNALSEWTTVEVKRGGVRYRQEYERGVPTTPVKEMGTAKGTGTKITFKPDLDLKFFENAAFDFDLIEHRLRELAFLNAGVAITLKDERGEGRQETFKYDGGLAEYLAWLSRTEDVIHPPIYVVDSRDQVQVEVALQYTTGEAERTRAYSNNIHNPDGGTHISGLRASLTRTIGGYGGKNGLIKDSVTLVGEDYREGLAAIVSVRAPHVQYNNQAKQRLVTPEIEGVVASVVGEHLARYLEEHPQVAKKIVQKVVLAAEAREAAAKARQQIRKQKTLLNSNGLPGKLMDCTSKNRDECELFLVEGDSAGGSADGGRERFYQAVLPLRGKILNVEKARIEKMLANEEICNIIAAIGTDIGEAEDTNKRNYDKLILLTDADVDGSHIRTLLLTFLYRQMPKLLAEGHVYLAQPPLYKLTQRKTVRYLQTREALSKELLDRGLNGTKLHLEATKKAVEGDDLRRLVEILQNLEHALFVLERRGLNLAYLLDIAQGGTLPSYRVFLSGRQHWFTKPADVDAFCQAERQKLAPPAAAAGETPAQVDLPVEIVELHEVKSIIKGLDRLHEFGLGAADLVAVKPVAGIEPPPRYYLEHDDNRRPLPTLRDLPGAVQAVGEKGMSITRYKGLGEMNPDELWDTTLDPARRTLLKITLEDAYQADELFRILMGDKVEPRREFIEKHALEVRNLDV